MSVKYKCSRCHRQLATKNSGCSNCEEHGVIEDIIDLGIGLAASSLIGNLFDSDSSSSSSSNDNSSSFGGFGGGDFGGGGAGGDF